MKSFKKYNKHLIVLVASYLLLLGATLYVDQNQANISPSVRAAGNANLVVLGDSITNTGATNSLGWVNQYKTDLANQLQMVPQITNLATNGITSQQLLDSVTNESNYRTQIGNAKIVTLEIGYNDFLQNRGLYQSGTCGGADNQDCLRSMVSNFKANWSGLLTQIRQLTANQSGSIALRSFDIYYSVAGVDQAGGTFSVLNSYLSQMNSYIDQTSTQNGFLMASVHSAYNGASGIEDPIGKGYILPDAVHPTDLGHTIIADRMVALGYAPFIIDSDNDGCPDAKEVGSDWKLGGQRDPNNRWDFYDVPVPALSAANWSLPIGSTKRPRLDKVIQSTDAQAIYSYMGTKKGGAPNTKGFSYDTHYGYMMGLTNDPNFTDGMFYDRSLSTDQTKFWQTGAPHGGISAQTAQLAFSLFTRGGSNCR